MSTAIPESIRSVYFLGIGGIGMSALARYFRQKGLAVSGYDADRSGLGKVLEKEGITVHYTEEESMLEQMPDLVVYTPAIPRTHKGFGHFRNAGVPIVKRSELLGWISREYACIAVAGTHGKTTTSAMITYAMRECGVSVTAFLGGLIPDLGGNFVKGDSEWLVVEADEYDRSFLTLRPKVAVVTAMDPDHLDIYGDPAAMIESYLGFLRNVQDGGVAVLHTEVDQKIPDGVRDDLVARNVTICTYGEQGSVYETGQPERTDAGTRFRVTTKHEGVELVMQMPGMHNALNATAALAVCHVAGIKGQKAAAALGRFSGITRRFEVVHATPGLVVIDDYAHHPEELKAAIGAARLQYPGRKLTGVFQPHLYTRTRDFYKEFAAALDRLDVCVLVELYPAREEPIEGVSSEMILKEMSIENKYMASKQSLIKLLGSLDPEVLLLLGAGDLDRMIPDVIENLTRS